MIIKNILELYKSVFELVQLDRDKSAGIRLSGATRMKLADSLRTLVSHVKNYEEKRIELFIAFGTKVPGKEDSYEVKTDAAGYDEFKKQIKEMEELEREVKLDSLTRGDLFGSSPDIDKQNQIPIDILSVFLEHGLLRE